jgi:hypothetical protein
MTPEFDKLVQEILTEAQKCTHPTTTQLSDHESFRYTKCIRNPYSTGIRRLYFWRTDGTFDFKRCAKAHKKGTEAYENCKLYHKIMRKRRLAALKRKSQK